MSIGEVVCDPVRSSQTGELQGLSRNGPEGADQD